MQQQQRTEQTLTQRMQARLYYLATREIELAEGLLLALSINRVVLLAWPPFELSVLGFYAPLVNTLQLALWVMLVMVQAIGWVSGSVHARAAGLVFGTGLWAFSAFTTFVYADSKQLAFAPFVFALASFGVLLRLGARWPGGD